MACGCSRVTFGTAARGRWPVRRRACLGGRPRCLGCVLERLSPRRATASTEAGVVAKLLTTAAAKFVPVDPFGRIGAAIRSPVAHCAPPLVAREIYSTFIRH